MSGLQLKTAPTDEPVSLEEAILYARWESGTDEDDQFSALITLGREQTEGITEHQLNTATWIQSFNGWQRCFLLDKPPLQSVTTITFIDVDDITQTVSSSDYIVHTESEHRGIVQFKKDFTFPELRDERLNSISVEFVAGYEGWPILPLAARGVPETLKLAIKLFVNDCWSHREYDLDGKLTGSIQDNPTAKQILNSYKVYSPTSIGFASSVPQFIR